jgi:hypothetical protein
MVGNGNFSTKGTSKDCSRAWNWFDPNKGQMMHMREYIGNGLLVQMF